LADGEDKDQKPIDLPAVDDPQRSDSERPEGRESSVERLSRIRVLGETVQSPVHPIQQTAVRPGKPFV
jgi:hypothetical protein